jgi:hypothetical protein
MDWEEMLWQLRQAYCPFCHAGPFVACDYFDEFGFEWPRPGFNVGLEVDC